MGANGVLLVNLGTPEAPSKRAVIRYLKEFLLDPKVMDLPWLKRQILVRALIIPFRWKKSMKSYQAIWTKEGSPLLVYGEKVRNQLQEKLGRNFHVELAMRYQSPSIGSALKTLMAKKVENLVVIPLFPQYAAATSGSVIAKTFDELRAYDLLPKLTLIDQFHSHPAVIEAFKNSSDSFDLKSYDHILFSFHGLPERQLKKSNSKCCGPNCCAHFSENNASCYAAQCYQTAFSIAKRLNLAPSSYTICFQSRLGKDPWIQPFTADKIKELADLGAKKVLVFCPSFVADCLETLFEISVEYQELFLHHGGEKLDLVPGMNTEPAWIEALEMLVRENI